MSQHKRVSMTDINESTAKTLSKQTAVGGGVTDEVPVLSLPTTADHPSLMSLTDKRSTYASVARTCLQLNQFAGSGSSSAASLDDDNLLFHDVSFAKMISSSHAALIECAQGHADRRCRILACKTLALVARSAYARLRHSPLLFGIREGTLHRLEDEVGTDVPVALCTVALEDIDDGVSACAMEALGMLTLSNNMNHDALLREVEAIAHARPSPHVPTLTLLEDDDYSIPQQELESRVYENVLSPRLWRLLRRILHFGSPSSHLMRTLPFLTACLGHLVVQTNSFGMDRTDYAKRWVEVDSRTMVQEVVTALLLPSMQQNDSGLAYTASICSIRLVNVCLNASWAPEVLSWTVSVLVDQIVSCEIMEQKMVSLATLLIALRAVPLPERARALELVVHEVRLLPSTTRVPAGVVSPGVLSLRDGSYRRPARIGFLAEVALSFFVDEHNVDGDSDDTGNARSVALKRLLVSAEVTAALTARSGKKGKKAPRTNSTQSIASGGSNEGTGTNAPGEKTLVEEYVGTHVGEELVLAFCQLASQVGTRVMMPRDGKNRSSRNLEDWLRCSLAVLSSFSACLNWKSRTSLEEEDETPETLFTMLAAAQGSYIRLLQECLYTVGLLSPASSVSLHIMPLVMPSSFFLLEELATSSISLSAYDPVSGVDFAYKDLVTLVDQFLEYKIREGIPSRHMRVFLLSLLTDHWVQSSHLATVAGPRDVDEPGAMNELNARELLAILSEEISSLAREIYADKEEEGATSSKTPVNQKYLKVCVACIENVALTACEWARRVAAGRTSAEMDEDARYIVSVALAALDGKNLRDGDTNEPDKDEASRKHPMLPLCAEASKRIQEVEGSGQASHTDAFGIGGEAPAVYSSLVAAARVDIKSGLESVPFISTKESRMVDGDAVHYAYLAQYSLQVLASRFDLAIRSTPLADIDDRVENTSTSRIASDAGVDDGPSPDVPNVLRAKNVLRLALPPIPSSTLAKLTWGPGSNLSWKGSTSTVTAASDPVAVVVACFPRRGPRYDCEPEYHLDVSIKVHNTTAVEIANGIRLALAVTQQSEDWSDSISYYNQSRQLFSTSAIYRHELKAGDHLTWEVSLPHLPVAGGIKLRLSIVFREMEIDGSTRWVGKGNEVNEESEASAKNRSLESRGDSVNEEDEIDDITLVCEPVELSFMASLQPCPLVFFRRAYGGENAFRFIWFHLAYETMGFKVVPNESTGKTSGTYVRAELASAVASLSLVRLQDSIQNSETKAWAFATLSGSRLFCVMRVDRRDNQQPEATIQFRSDNEALVKSLTVSKGVLSEVVSALDRNRWCYEATTTEIASESALNYKF